MLWENDHTCIKRNEVYLAISGSGTTNTLSNAKAAKKLGLKIIAVTSKEESELGQLADCIIKVPGKNQRRSKNGFHSTA